MGAVAGPVLGVGAVGGQPDGLRYSCGLLTQCEAAALPCLVLLLTQASRVPNNRQQQYQQQYQQQKLCRQQWVVVVVVAVCHQQRV